MTPPLDRRLPPHIEHARQPNQLIMVLCLDCGPADLVGVKRYSTETGRCATCGSGSILKLGAVKELKRLLHQRTMQEIEEVRKRRMERRRRGRRR